MTLRWRHNGRDSVSNHQPRDCLLNRLFRYKSKKTSQLRVTGLCVGNSPGTGEFPAQMASNAENFSIWWRHHEYVIELGQHCAFYLWKRHDDMETLATQIASHYKAVFIAFETILWLIYASLDKKGCKHVMTSWHGSASRISGPLRILLTTDRERKSRGVFSVFPLIDCWFQTKHSYDVFLV